MLQRTNLINPALSAEKQQKGQPEGEGAKEQAEDRGFLVFVRNKADQAEKQAQRSCDDEGQPAKGCNGTASAAGTRQEQGG